MNSAIKGCEYIFFSPATNDSLEDTTAYFGLQDYKQSKVQNAWTGDVKE